MTTKPEGPAPVRVATDEPQGQFLYFACCLQAGHLRDRTPGPAIVPVPRRRRKGRKGFQRGRNRRVASPLGLRRQATAIKPTRPTQVASSDLGAPRFC